MASGDRDRVLTWVLVHGLLSCLVLCAVCHDLSQQCKRANGECTCSRVTPSAVSFRLFEAAQTGTCVQRTSDSHYVCDCSGDTLCRAAPLRSALRCVGDVTEKGECDCVRASYITPNSASLLPLRPAAAVVRNVATTMCSETPQYWAREGRSVLHMYWHVISERDSYTYSNIPQAAATNVVRVGHQHHAVIFSSSSALASALPGMASPGAIQGDHIDPSYLSVNRMVSECTAAMVSVKLAEAGIATRAGIRVDKVDIRNRLILKTCAHVSSDNAALGMTVGRILERASLATGYLPVDDAGISERHITSACKAINRNFEACRTDAGCLAYLA